MAICKNCGKEISDTAKVCRFCGTKTAFVEKGINTCPNCGSAVSLSDKFCQHCGSPLSSVSKVEEKSSERTCPNCGKSVPVEAKVCRYCGSALPKIDWEAAINSRNETVFRSNQQISIDMSTQFEFVNDCITWTLLPGQIAIRFNGNDLDSFVNAKGVIVQEGTKALFFDQGAFVGCLAPGKYMFEKDKGGSTSAEKPSKKGSGFFSKIQKGFSDKLTAIFKKKKKQSNRTTSTSIHRTFEVSVVLIRDSEFPLLFEFDDVPTKNLRSNVGLHIIGSIVDLEDFYAYQLMDKKFVCYDSLSRSVEPMIRNAVNRVLSTIKPDEVENNSEIQLDLLNALKDEIESICPYLDVERIVSLTAVNKEIERIKRLKEELYIAEQDLIQVQARYDFQNKLQTTENQQKLTEARTKTDFEALMDKIDEDGMINKDKREEFIMHLMAEKTLREAKNKDEVDEQLLGFVKNGLLRNEQVDTLKKEIAQRSALADLRNEHIIEDEKINWQASADKRRAESELELNRMKDKYSDERREADLEFEAKEKEHQFEMLRKMQAIKQEEKDAEHKREMDILGEKNRSKEEMNRMFSSMTADQILAANPDITPEAAMAMAEKFKAEAANNSKEEIKDTILQQQEMNMQLMQQMMKTMSGMSSNQMSAKDAEINRIYNDSQRNQENFTKGVNNAVSSVAGALKNTERAGSSKVVKKGIVCPNCGTTLDDDALFCDECGTKLK